MILDSIELTEDGEEGVVNKVFGWAVSPDKKSSQAQHWVSLCFEQALKGRRRSDVDLLGTPWIRERSCHGVFVSSSHCSWSISSTERATASKSD